MRWKVFSKKEKKVLFFDFFDFSLVEENFPPVKWEMREGAVWDGGG